MMPQFSGTTAECMKHYAGQFRIKSDAIREIEKTTGFKRDTVKEWFFGNNPVLPNGSRVVILRYFFEDRGYRVKELEDLKIKSPEAYQLGRLLYEKKLTLEDIKESVGYKNAYDVYSILHGRYSMRSIWLVNARELIRSMESDAVIKSVAEDASLVLRHGLKTRTESSSNHLREDVLKILAGYICATIPLAKLVISDKFSDEDRERLRKLTSGDGIFALSNLLNGLCGRRSREILKIKNRYKEKEDAGI